MSSNYSVVELDNGKRICLSYGVPVAAFVPGKGFIKTERKYSVTTSRHANAFCHGEPQVVSDAAFRSLIAPVVGGER